ncbi:cation/multidrug efflux pump [Rivularia sp. PCC 7116]|uniref:efflux RND transporter permease subunit n=1 Tax=Rivularia sp. PCC 7116 TaxID=373994 RepID=UPI00029F1ED1|nr:efflux RND transporter permease subunit [Rivularia sp. PCC 7116]AFY52639.1 cation/multidrug efflux pump [Rivularia sp. PCC 7116]
MVLPFFRNVRLLILTFVLIIFWGLSAFQSLPRQEDPQLVARTGIVTTIFPGASAERVEALVTEVIESEMSEIEEINTITSDSRIGLSTVSIELKDTVSEAEPIWTRVRDKLADAEPQFPSGVLEPDLDEAETRAYAVIASLVWEGKSEPNYAILRRFAQELDVQLRGVGGTEKVDTFGFPSEEITVEINPSDLAAVGLNAQQLSQQIQQSDAKVSAGQLRSPRNTLAIEVEGELDSLERIRQIPISSTTSGQFTRLGDIARVNRGIRQPVTDLALIGSKPAVALGVLMEPGNRIDLWAGKIREQLEDFRQRVPNGIKLEVIFDQSSYVETRLDNLISNLLFSAFLVVAVTFVGMGWRSSLIVGAALPLTVFAVFGELQIFNIPIHQMSVSGLIIALGLLIDNAIVVVDEIQVELEHGLKPKDAVVKTVNYLTVPLLTSSLTTILTFLPIGLLPGGAGEFVGSIAWGVIMSLVSSLVISLTVIAALSGRFLAQTQVDEEDIRPKRKSRKSRLLSRLLSTIKNPHAWWNSGLSSPFLGRIYRKTLNWATAKPLIAIVLTMILPVMGFINVSSLPTQFFPSLNRDQFQIEVEFPAQTSIAQSREDVLLARKLIQEHSQVEEVHWFVGESAPKFYYNFTGGMKNAAYYAQAMVQLNTDKGVMQLIRTLQDELDSAFPSARVLVKQLEQGPPFEAPVEMRIFGPDIAELRRLGVQVREILTQIPDVTHARDDLTETLPKLGLEVDEEQARLVGLDNRAIAQQLETYLEGSVGGSILESTENLPVRVRIANSNRGDLSQIASLNLQPTQQTGTEPNLRPLSALGKFNLVPQLASISRRNEQRVNTVQAFISAGVLPSVVLGELQQRLQAQEFESKLPPGYRYEFGGEQAESGEATGNLMSTVGLLGLIMVITLVLSLGSFRMAGIVFAVGAGSVGLALFALWAFDSVFGFMAIVGTMGLIGIAINGAIIILSAFNEDEAAKNGDVKAVREVVVKATRHVLTTTITTMVGFIPLIADGDPFWLPLAIAIAGGIGGSPLLALYFTPAAYLLVKGRRKNTRKRKQLLLPPAVS